MAVFSIAMRALSLAASIFMLLCIIRIMLSWFPVHANGRHKEVLGKITDPYLEVWQRFRFLRVGNVDFSPIAGLAVLSCLSRLFNMASYGALSFGSAIALVIEVIWSPIAFLLLFFAALTGARIVAYLARWNSLHPAWRTIDAIINPVVLFIKRLIYRNRIVNYLQGLISALVVLAGSRFILGLVFKLVFSLLRHL
ncbi:YggT family protein [Spirochaetota bacterium]